MRTLGWANYLTIQMLPDRKTLKASYWMYATLIFINADSLIKWLSRRPAPAPSQMPTRLRSKLPLLGGTVTISIVETHRSAPSSSGPSRTPQKRAIARLQQKTKLGGAKPSDEVEGLGFTVHWEPTKGALGVFIPSEQLVLPADALQVVSQNNNFLYYHCLT
jgi:mediator of RNA polymerase II transcription subunit 14